MEYRQTAAPATAFLILALTVLLPSGYAAPTGLTPGVGVHPPLNDAAPRRSSVVFSTRFKRDEAVSLSRAFGATRIEWVYLPDAAFATALRHAAPWLGGALSGMAPLSDDAGFARDFDGKILAAPWAKSFDGRWASTTHPETQRDYSERIRRLISYGVDSIQHDDPQMQAFSALYQGGDFNESTLALFPAWLARNASTDELKATGLADMGGDYRAWLRSRHGIKSAEDYRQRWRSLPSSRLWLAFVRSTVADHMRRVREQARTLRGRAVPISMNLGDFNEPLASNPFYFLAPLADYALNETPIDSLSRLTSQAATLRSLGLGFVPSIMPRSKTENRAAIATLYGLGGTALVPWDTYVGNDDAGQVKRFFGSPDDYGDLYRFVRGHAALFDTLETAPLVGIAVPVDAGRQADIRALVDRLVTRRIPFAFVPVGTNGDVRYRAQADGLRSLALVVATNPLADYPEADRSALDAVGAVALAGLRDGDLDAVAPFLAGPQGEGLRILPRADPADASRLVLHVVDATRGEAGAAEPGCRRRVGIRRAALDGRRVSSIAVSSPTPGVAVQNAGYDGDYFFTVVGCPLWAVVEMRLGPE